MITNPLSAIFGCIERQSTLLMKAVGALNELKNIYLFIQINTKNL